MRSLRQVFTVLLCTVSVAAQALPPTPPPPPPVASPLTESKDVTRSHCGTLADIQCSLVFLPLASLLLPGFGQYWDGERGWPYTTAAVAGLLAAGAASSAHGESAEFSLTKIESQAMLLGAQLWLDAALLSSYETYRHRIIDELGSPEDLSSVSSILLAPADFRALTHFRVLIPWVLIGALGIGSAFIDEENTSYSSGPFEEFRWHDGVFSLGASYGAGVGEEAFFRGYMLHGLDRVAGWHPLVANLAQSSVFAASHADFSYAFLVRMGFGMYSGWLAQSANYNLRDAVFLHTWWDLFLFVGSLANARRTDTVVTFSLPTIAF